MTTSSDSIAAFVDRYGDRAAEVLWTSALVWLERIADEGRDGGTWFRWRSRPRSELRLLRHELAGALAVAHLAVSMQESQNERYAELDRDLRVAAEQAARRHRRAGTLEAERVRLLQAQARGEGRELTIEERLRRRLVRTA